MSTWVSGRQRKGCPYFDLMTIAQPLNFLSRLARVCRDGALVGSAHGSRIVVHLANVDIDSFALHPVLPIPVLGCAIK